MDKRIENMRAEIDEADAQIVRAIGERLRLCLAIGTVKAELGLPVEDLSREAVVLEKYLALAEADEIPSSLHPEIKAILQVILNASKKLQSEIRELEAAK